MHKAYSEPRQSPPDIVTGVPPSDGPELGCNVNSRKLVLPHTMCPIPSVLKSCPLLLTSTVMLPICTFSSITQYTTEELTYLASVPTLHRSPCDCTKCLPVTRSTRLLVPSACSSVCLTPVTVGTRSYTYCMPLDVMSAPLLLTSTDTVCSHPALGDTHAIMLDVSHCPSTITGVADPSSSPEPRANTQPSPDPALKPDPSTRTTVDPSTAPADGMIPVTTRGASYSNISSDPWVASSPSARIVSFTRPWP